jgi:hypothetical protein
VTAQSRDAAGFSRDFGERLLTQDGSRCVRGVHPLADAREVARLRATKSPRRLGHSVDVLVYAGVFDGERERSNALIDAALEARLG